MKPTSDTAALEQYETLERAGRSATQIAQHFGVTPRTIRRWRRDTGRAHPAPTPRGNQEREQARRLIEDGCSLAEVARTVGVAATTVRKWFPDAPAWSKREAGLYRQMLYGFQGRADVRPSVVKRAA